MPENTPPPSRRALQLRIKLLMAERNIRSTAELHRRLIKEGVEISHPQLWRVVENRSSSLSVPLLNALINLFQCDISDLFVVAREGDKVISTSA